MTHSAVDVVMVPHERKKSSDLRPANAQVLGRVSEESEDVGTDKWNSIHLEFQNSCNQKPQQIYLLIPAPPIGVSKSFVESVTHVTHYHK